jgi:Na+/phosphate symporter
MGTDLLLLVSIALLTFAARSYSSTVSLVFEILFIKFFRTLRPSYLASYVRSVVISWLSLRNQAISFVGLSFLNSGIIPNFQSLGLILGSYFGLSLALLYLNLYETPLKFFFIGLSLIFGFFSTRHKAIQISKMFFFAAMILFGFELLMHSLNFNSPIVSNLELLLSLNRLSIIAIALILCFAFRNSFAVLAVLYAFYLKNLISDDQVINAILSVVIFNSLWYMVRTKNAHRETKAVSYAVVLISALTGLLIIATQIIFPSWFIQKDQSLLAFTLNCLILSLVMGIFGYFLSLRLEDYTNQFFPKGKVKDIRQIQIFTSKNNYPITYLVEFFEQEYKKLFALINTIQSLMLSQWVNPADTNQTKIEKYAEISKRILKEMEDLEIQMNQSERTYRQAQKMYKLRDKITGLKSLLFSLNAIYQIKLKILDSNHPNLEQNKTFFVQPIQKIQEFTEFIFSSYIETETENIQQVTALLGQLKEDLTKFRDDLITLKESLTFTKDEMELLYEFTGQIQIMNIAIHKIAH